MIDCKIAEITCLGNKVLGYKITKFEIFYVYNYYGKIFIYLDFLSLLGSTTNQGMHEGLIKIYGLILPRIFCFFT